MEKLKSIPPESLQKCILDKYREGYARKTLTIFHTVLKSDLNQAVYSYKLLIDNPMQYVKTPKIVRRKSTKSDLKIFF